MNLLLYWKFEACAVYSNFRVGEPSEHELINGGCRVPTKILRLLDLPRVLLKACKAAVKVKTASSREEAIQGFTRQTQRALEDVFGT